MAVSLQDRLLKPVSLVRKEGAWLLDDSRHNEVNAGRRQNYQHLNFHMA